MPNSLDLGGSATSMRRFPLRRPPLLAALARRGSAVVEAALVVAIRGSIFTPVYVRALLAAAFGSVLAAFASSSGGGFGGSRLSLAAAESGALSCAKAEYLVSR